MQQHYGFSPFAFSICFAVNAVAIGVAAAISVKFRQPETGTLTGCIGMLCLSVCVMIALYNGCGFWTYELLMFALLFTMGLTFTSSTTLAMDSERRYAGAASALLGARRYCFSVGRLGKYPCIYRSYICGLRHLFPALCTMGDEESTDESSNVPDFPLK